MKNISLIANIFKKCSLYAFCLIINLSTLMAQESLNLRTIPFDRAWLFTKDSVTNAEQTDFNDSKWRKVDLPHDWSIEDLPNQTTDQIVGPFSKK